MMNKLDPLLFVEEPLAGDENAGFMDIDTSQSMLLSRFRNPSGICVSSWDESIFIADQSNNRIRKITNNTITTIGGNGKGNGGPFDDMDSLNCSIDRPSSICIDSNDSIIFTQVASSYIHKITSDGRVWIVAGGGMNDCGRARQVDIGKPHSLMISPNNQCLYFTDCYYHSVWKLSTDDQMIRLAGSGQCGYMDGFSNETSFNQPRGLCYNNHTNMIAVCDILNHAIRLISDQSIAQVNTLYQSCQSAITSLRFSPKSICSIDQMYLVSDMYRNIHQLDGKHRPMLFDFKNKPNSTASLIYTDHYQHIYTLDNHKITRYRNQHSDTIQSSHKTTSITVIQSYLIRKYYEPGAPGMLAAMNHFYELIQVTSFK